MTVWDFTQRQTDEIPDIGFKQFYNDIENKKANKNLRSKDFLEIMPSKKWNAETFS